MMVGTASDWQADVAREATIQVRPVSGRDIEADVRSALNVAQSTAGIARGAGLYQRGIGKAGRTLARLRARAQRPAYSAPDRDQARVRRDAGSGGVAQIARRASAERQSRRPPRLDRPHARHGGNGSRCRRLRSWLWSSWSPCSRSPSPPAAPWRPISRLSKCCIMSAPPTASSRASSSATFFFSASKAAPSAAAPPSRCSAIVAAINAWFAGTPSGDETAALFGTFSVSIAGYVAILALIALMAIVTGARLPPHRQSDPRQH